MNTPALLLSLALLGAVPPYPPPKVVPYSEALKSDSGSVVAIDSAISELRLNTPAGLVIYKVPPSFPVLDATGKSAGTVSGLRAGQRVRVYYVVENGAQIQELILE